jgi:hypothetical protein
MPTLSHLPTSPFPMHRRPCMEYPCLCLLPRNCMMSHRDVPHIQVVYGTSLGIVRWNNEPRERPQRQQVCIWDLGGPRRAWGLGGAGGTRRAVSAGGNGSAAGDASLWNFHKHLAAVRFLHGICMCQVCLRRVGGPRISIFGSGMLLMGPCQ